MKEEKCGEEVDMQMAAMYFPNGDTKNPKYLCFKCAPSPFESLMREQ